MKRFLQVTFLFVALAPLLEECVRGETLYCKRVTGSEERTAFFVMPYIDVDQNYDIGGAEAAVTVSTPTMGGASSAGGFYGAAINDIVATPAVQCFDQILVGGDPSWNMTHAISIMEADFEVQPSSIAGVTNGQVSGYLSIIGSQSMAGEASFAEEDGSFNAKVGPYEIGGGQTDYGSWTLYLYSGGVPVASYETGSQGGVIFFEFPVQVNSTIPMDLSQTFYAYATGAYSINIASTAYLTFSVEAYDPNSEEPVSQLSRVLFQSDEEEEPTLIYSNE